VKDALIDEVKLGFLFFCARRMKSTRSRRTVAEVSSFRCVRRRGGPNDTSYQFFRMTLNRKTVFIGVVLSAFVEGRKPTKELARRS
jgi:hypothetical protein